MRVIHFSDWHSDSWQLPEADLYICTGDMYPNFPCRDNDFQIVPWYEEQEQKLWAKKFLKWTEGQIRFASKDAPIVCVRGNHDFAPITPLFEGYNMVHEFVDNELIEVNGLKITGHRGIPYIYGGWNDEVQCPDLIDRVRRMSKADIFLTHYGPSGILQSPRASVDYGLSGMANVMLMSKMNGSKALHCFGHIHEAGGKTEELSGFTWSNAATTFNVIEFDP